MQDSIPKSRQTSIISKKPVFFVWKIENFDELQLPESLIFFAEILHAFFTYKRVFQILFRSWDINKNVKNECVGTRFF